ncbi:TPA: BREX-1 system phosphatase PglZ type A [Legionella pneumophila]|uniref:BREX-1 system phosphatase PglZ type A n=1 Tax=Legionella pneumophila TaxID=446 RepID=UPI000770729E|nr:BREX-1 system phosphatase PglZ type A [Legionella pneumophila]HAT8823098.1 BREX-1 system phosphatase PglZ type A [Legionella pneumophila subsp. pneumophila]MBN5928700.1 BREX-1 system phosphatase PglZ type A [Legionella pneumophila]MDO5158038.1 BREX-1 system phosphatase PglZ type A [Legionella pneumophila]MDO5161965.1 BREX-1 system phosphatase PglZ type A [Legionella pneumophila]MDO5164269.1 BREX-1 system phosphatase PglZ type A [Legionella pneumophila]
MSDRIALTLSKLFERHRIVFWYDTKKELREDFETIQLSGIEKLELSNNQYGIKYKILREQPAQKFLLYYDGPQPDDLNNWLLDVQLAHGEFRTDQVAIWLSELELGFEFTDVIQPHVEFFQAGKRKDALKKLLKANDTAGQIRLKMLAVCTGSEPRLDAVAKNLLQELADGHDEKIKLVGRCGLDNFLWEQMTLCYGYISDEPGIRDFVIELFKSCYAMGTDGQVKLTGDALVFLKSWKDSRQFEAGFETLSEECAEVLGIEQNLTNRDFRELIDLNYFRLIDLKIISDLVRAVASRTVSSGDVSLWVRQRRQSHWYRQYQHLYEAIDYASRFIHALGEANLTMNSLAEGVQRYSDCWYQLDQLYRKFTYHVRISGQASLMAPLTEQIENFYSNNYLFKLGNCFQTFVDEASRWEAAPVKKQSEFFEQWVRPFLRKDNKVCVLISDAMRYEIGDELLSLIRQEDRYSAELKPALSMLPSYTQLGMAALLPHKKLEISDNESGTVLVDGLSSQGTINRTKILGLVTNIRATACKADELMAMKKDDCRALVRDHDLIYVYHNRIDATGDKRETEERVFEAVEETLQDLIRLIKKLAGANATNLLVTADHGFIYQNRTIDESDFSGIDAEGEKVLFRDRRFVLGKGLAETSSLRKFTPKQLGLSGEVEVQIPKSINRLRLKGSGSRFVHGGASLQEVVIPVLKIHKKRQSDVTAVEVDILRGASSVITSGQLAVTMYQAGPVTDKVQPRVLRAGIYTEAGELISDSHDLTFDLSSDNPRERELQVRFVLTRMADEVNGQEVILRLEEKHAGTSHYKEYKSLRYMMRRSFTSDFDF